jgi:2-dehydro-3-deoxygalactonokinase
VNVGTRTIALDWGTTSLRAYRLDGNGAVLEQREGGPGILRVEGGAFEAALRDFCGDWLNAFPEATLMASGMIGSKQGWKEVPYCPCPADLPALARHLAHVTLHDGRRLAIVPGVSFVDAASGVPDVMRGEETQIMGALPATGSHVAVLPGTHSKWAWVEEGAIVSFASFMTGEVYAALTGHTILGRLMQPDAPPDDAAFARGVGYGLEAPAALLSRIFSARTLGLFEQLSATALPSYLSGLLIGSELGAALAMHPGTRVVCLLGGAALVDRYARACALAGVSTSAGPADCATTGMARILAASPAP